MKTTKVIIHIADYESIRPEAAIVRAEIVARLGKAQKKIKVYEPFWDEEIEAEFILVDWWSGERVPLFFISNAKLRKAFETVNLFPLESI